MRYLVFDIVVIIIIMYVWEWVWKDKVWWGKIDFFKKIKMLFILYEKEVFF